MATAAIAADRQILLFVAGQIGGIAHYLMVGDPRYALFAAMIAGLLWGISLGRATPAALTTIYMPFLLPLAGAALGGAALWLQMTQMAAPDLNQGLHTVVTGRIIAIDGHATGRSRVWIKIGRSDGPIRPGQTIRISTQTIPTKATPGSHISIPARLYPPPGPLLPGAADYGLQARAKGIVASGFATGAITVGKPSIPDWPTRLAAYRFATANYLAARMKSPAGGIAAALLVGDRRYIAEATHDIFRRSGLAHLLAISGLHMGLLCFGVISLLRVAGALFPAYAIRVPLHKICALLGLAAAGGYVVLSGMPISAVRAFLMAGLVITAILLDRLALTMRNVALAAILILIVNPLALLTAGFQLSLSATLALVVWYEALVRARDGRAIHKPLPRPLRYLTALVASSLIAGLATMPFAAHHFGGITLWGIFANIAGIPLTGLWIMPAGLLVCVIHALPFPAWIDGASLALMEFGLRLLVRLAGVVAAQPHADWRVIPPGYGLLSLGLMGWLITLLWPKHKRARIIGCSFIAVAFFLWAIKPLPDAVLLARGHMRTVILAGADGEAHIIRQRASRALSGYVRNSASLFLAQRVPDGTVLPKPSDTKRRRQVSDRQDRVAGIALRRRALSNACQARAAFILSFATPRYPCRDGTPIIDLASLPKGNHLLWIADDGSLRVKTQR